MINILLNTLIFLLCSAIGYTMSLDYKCRAVNLQSLIDGLGNLESEITYRKAPLPEALETVSSEKAANGAKALFGRVAGDLAAKANCSLPESWSANTEELSEACSFTAEDVHIIKELGKELGSTDIYAQSAMLRHACSQLQGQLAQAVEEKNTKGKMYKSLGIAVGLTLVIILI